MIAVVLIFILGAILGTVTTALGRAADHDAARLAMLDAERRARLDLRVSAPLAAFRRMTR